MSTDSLWYAGPCVKRHDLVTVVAKASLRDDKLITLENPQKLFGKTCEVDLKLNAAKPVRSGDWVLFQLLKQGRANWQAGTYKRLVHFADLSHLNGLEGVRRHLLTTGICAGASGVWVVKVGGEQVIEVELRSAFGSMRLHQDNTNVTSYAFASSAVIATPQGGEDLFYDYSSLGQPIQALDWAGDEMFAARVLRSIADVGDPRVADLIAWLEDHAKRAPGAVVLKRDELAGAYMALRSGALARRLAADRELGNEYMEALLRDSKIAASVRARVEAFVMAEQKAARVKVDAELEQWSKTERQERKAFIAIEFKNEELERKKQLDVSLAHSERALAEALEGRIGRAEEAWRVKFEAKKEKQSRDLETAQANHHFVLEDANRVRRELDQSQERLQATNSEVEQAGLALDRLLAAQDAVRVSSDSFTGASEATFPIRSPEPGLTLVCEKVLEVIGASPLLSDAGKKLMLQFVALVLAGEMPVLYGPEVDDFLLIAEGLISSGSSSRLEADPTMITLEDLFSRVGAQGATSLGQAVKSMRAGERVGLLAVIQHAERSGGRFWFPALAAHARNGDLPRGLFVCATVSDWQCDEAQFLFSSAASLHIVNSLAARASIICVAVLGHGPRYELDSGARSASVLDGIEPMAAFAHRLSLGAALRAARAVTEARKLGSVTVEDMTSIVTLFTPPGAHVMSAVA